MFRSAKIKLTAWYLVIIMFVTLSFSFFVYLGVYQATQRALEGQRRRLERQFNQLSESGFIVIQNGDKPGPKNPLFDPPFKDLDGETLVEVRQKTLILLAVLNIFILFISGALGYVLAGKTLKPIEEMVKKQNRFISDAAHELRTPLTAMKIDMEVALRNKKLDLEEAKHVLNSSIEEVDDLTNFTTRLLEKSRYQQKLPVKKFENIDVEVPLSKVVSKLKNMAESKNVALKSEISSVNVFGDITSLEELFINIIENAIKYSNSDSSVEIKCFKDDGFAVVTVQDYGEGIDEKDISQVFEPFFRSDKSRTRGDSSGYGLGLAISKSIIDMHNGKIDIESKKGEGTVVTLKIPRV